MTYDKHIVQFVCFQTRFDRQAFLARWAPFATSFIEKGIERIVLAECDAAPEGFAFISRNEWPEDRFLAAFRGQLPADAGGGGVVAVQGGAFRVVASADADSRGGRSVADKVVVLVGVLPGALTLAVDELRRLAVTHATGAGWTVFARDPATRGGRFDAVLELNRSSIESTSPTVRDAIGSQLAAAPYLKERHVLAMYERLTLP